MKKAAAKQWLEEVQERLSTDHLDNHTNLFDLVGISEKIDPQTVEIIRRRVNIYLESWIRPNLERAIDELK